MIDRVRLQDGATGNAGMADRRIDTPLQRLRFQMLRGTAERRLRELPSASVATTVTSPPYYRQKDYGVGRQLGWETSVAEYTAKVRTVLLELLRVTAESGSCFLVVGDTYRDKSLQLVPHRLAIAAHDCGWTVRSDLIWEKLDAAPDGARDRWRSGHEHVLFLTKRPRGYRFDASAIRLPYGAKTVARWGNGQRYGGRKAKDDSGPNGQRFARGRSFVLHPKGAIAGDVLRYPTARSSLDHFATYPIELIEPFILATTAADDLVLDPFAGTGTTGVAALQHGRRFLGIDLNARYVNLAVKRLNAAARTLGS